MKQIQIESLESTHDAVISPPVTAVDTAVHPSGEESGVRAENAVEMARAAVHRHAKRRQRTVNITVVGFTAFTVIFTAAMQWMLRRYGDDPEFWRVQFPVLTVLNLVLLLASACGLLWRSMRTGRTVRGHARALASDAQKASIGTLIELFKFEDLVTHCVAKGTLTKLLPTLRANDAYLLGAQHRATLNRILGSPPTVIGKKDLRELFHDTSKREVDLRVAILEGYKQVGDASALPIVAHLAAGTVTRSEHRRIRDAAADCLPYLKLRVEQQTASNSLLRGSSASSAPGDSLLRPATSRNTASGELLRPNDAS